MLWTLYAAIVLCAATISAEDWWKTAVLYQVYPRSFKDSDGDGVGDLKGIIQMADYFKELGVDAIWISPIYKSPMLDMGYDIENFTDIDPLFGTMDDFKAMAAKLKEIGIKLLMDMVPNHTSDQHPWFQISKNKSDPLHSDYRDFYIWRHPKGWLNKTTPIPPNNWISVFEGSAWQWCEERKQFYFHQFKYQQPDLNYRNPNLFNNMTAVLDFWMDKGVSGFRVDAVKFIFENDSFEDQPAIPGTKGNTYETQLHIYTEDQPETFDLIKYWAEHVLERNNNDQNDRAMWLEIYDPLTTVVKYYGTGNESMMVPFNFALVGMDQSSRASEFQMFVQFWMDLIPPGATTNWVLGNHDIKRVGDKCGHEMIDTMNLLSGVLPGVKVIYYGEEIGMQDTYIRPDQVKDDSVYARDPFRTPMQWDDTRNAGFSENQSTWLPVNPNYWWLNVEAQRNVDTSHLKVLKTIIQARKDTVLQRGDLNILVPDNDTLVVVRHYNSSYFVFVANVGSEVRNYTSQNLFGINQLDIDMTVVVASVNAPYKPGTNLKSGSLSVVLRPKASVVLKSGNSPSSATTVFGMSMMASLFMLLALIFNDI